MNLELKQKKLFAGERQFRFKDKTTLNVISKKLKKHNEYLIDVVALEPKVKGNFIFAKKTLVSFIVFLNISLVLHFTSGLDFLLAGNKDWYLAGAIIICLISLISFLVLTQYEQVFVARHSKVPLVRFYNGLPNKKEYKNFIKAMQQKSQQRFDHLKLNMQQQRAGELKTIRRVYEQGGITAEQYDNAKNTLLKFSDG